MRWHERSTKSKQLGWEDDVNLGSAEIFIVPHWIWRMVAVAVGDVEQKRDHLRDLDVVSKISIWGLSTYEHRYHSMSLRYINWLHSKHMSSYVEPLQLRGAQRGRASILGHVRKHARERASKKTCAHEAREQQETRAHGARAKTSSRASKARGHTRACFDVRAQISSLRGQISSHKLTERANKLT